MKMKIKMTLLSDTIFGNGVSTPGEEDISVQFDKDGFPYYRGSTFKGVFREKLETYLFLKGKTKEDADAVIYHLLGVPGNEETTDRVIFSGFEISGWVKNCILRETDGRSKSDVRNALTNIRTFTALDEEGTVKDGSLRMARCVNRGLVFFSTVDIPKEEDKEMIKDVLGMIKWIGTMRNRGFGKVRIEEV